MGFAGKSIYYSYLFDDSHTPWIDKDVYKNVFFTNKIKAASSTEIGSDADLYSVDFTNEQVRFDFHDAGMFTRAAFNGILISDRDNVLEPIAGFSLVSNMTGLDSSDIKIIKGDQIYINWQGVSFTENSYAWITLRFGRNRIEGTDGKDTVKGTTGDDLIIGHKGVDQLSGLAGSDVFVFDDGDTGKTNASADTILDFNFKERDEIDLSRWDANTNKHGMQHFTFIDTAAFTHHAGEVRAVKASSDTYIQGDTNGDGKTDFIIHLDDAVTMLKSYLLL
jgi:hypothetical protein